VYVENKYRPVFTQCQSTALPEATPPGTVVASVRAMDNDTGPAGEIVYSILRAGSERDFDVDPVSGVIRNNKVCTRTVFQCFHLFLCRKFDTLGTI